MMMMMMNKSQRLHAMLQVALRLSALYLEPPMPTSANLLPFIPLLGALNCLIFIPFAGLSLSFAHISTKCPSLACGAPLASACLPMPSCLAPF